MLRWVLGRTRKMVPFYNSSSEQASLGIFDSLCETPCKRLRPVFLMTAFVLPGNETNSSNSRPEKAGRVYFHRDSQDGVSKREVAATPAARGMWTTRKCRGSIETCPTFQYKDILSPGYLRVLVPLSARTWGQAHSYMGIKAHLL